MRIAFLVGRDAASTRRSVEAVCSLPGIKPVALLIDTEVPPLSKRLKSLRRNVRREGVSYLPHRLLEAVHDALEHLAARVVPEEETEGLLRAAFPDRSFSLAELGRRYGFPVLPVHNLNSPRAADLLKESGADLGIVLGTRILKRSTFGVPSQGSINLHKGKVPEYRGLPPGFWELYDGQESAGVTVHFVDEGLDTGDVIGTGTVPISDADSEETLRTKLDIEGARILAQCIGELRDRRATRVPQGSTSQKPRTQPTRRQREELRKRSPGRMPEPYSTKRLLKTAFYLALYHFRIYDAVRMARRWAGSSRAIILLYHRVNDRSVDSLTTSVAAFAGHAILLKRRYHVFSTSSLLERLEQGQRFPSNAVLIHFDDCYRDVWAYAAPVLRASELPATAFVASGFVGTNRQFEHDRLRSPFTHDNLSAEELRLLVASGVEIGAHTVNHVNLGRVPAEDIAGEVLGSRQDLERILGSPVVLFSFPFGRLSNISSEARHVIEGGGFRALFSAYGGVVTPHCDRFDIPRCGASTEHRPLDLMMEIEGLSISQWIPRWMRSRT